MYSNKDDLDVKKDRFTKLFNKVTSEETIVWSGTSSIGVSLIKDYPDDILFKPVRLRDGKKDSVALIKIGYRVNNLTATDESAPLVVTIGKASRYIFNHSFYDYNDVNSPTEESVKESDGSIQPIDLEDINYEYRFKTNEIWDKETTKYVKPEALVDKLFNQHLNTLTDRVFRAKMEFQKFLIEVIDPFNNTLIKINRYFFGKTIKKIIKDKDFFAGLLNPYNLDSLEDIQTVSEKPKVLGTDFPVTSNSATTFIVIVTAVYLIYYKFNLDLLGLVALFNSARENGLFLASIVSVMLMIVDRVLPFLILLTINLLIKAKVRLLHLKINIK